ncbi:lipocalin-15-like isoform X2 [Tachyglossus aculeatus]|uniref:lipocalin-15-like isoform X1 n=1 Tax=Tachyglossus aculeatus TaxID=9261 RepID=UPI0018F339A5|nr:lipocalin-15-like isoform X1 [Tachyglossus aculeatus]XP_038623945.1 lipocalin-15-like isoform X2 [Tachyglossus aculeatus]
MNSALLISLLGLVWVNHAQSNVPFKRSFNLNKFKGFWYVLGMATNSERFMEPKGLKKMAGTIVSTKNGQMGFKFSYHLKTKCKVENVYGREISRGKYHFPGNRDVYIIETDYQDYALMYLTAVLDGKVHRALLFYSRTRDPTSKGKKKFREISKSDFFKFQNDQIIMLVNSDDCINVLYQ